MKSDSIKTERFSQLEGEGEVLVENESFLQCTIDINKMLKTAIRFHQSGELQKAEEIYKKILEVHTNHSDCLHLLGVAAHQRGNSEMAVFLIKKAIRSNKNNPFYHNNLGAALREMGAQEEAIANYQKALQLKPDYAEAAYNMGSVLLLTGSLTESVSWYEKAIQIKPDYVDAYTNLAAGYNKLNRPDDALICCQNALALNPNCAEALNNMGNALMALNKQNEAIACFRKSISIEAANPEAHCNLGNAFHDLGRPEEALDCYRSALKLNPGYGEAYNNMGIALREQGRLNEAMFSYQKAMQLRPEDPEAYHNMGNVFKDQVKLKEAIGMYQRAIDRNPALIDSYVNLGTALEEQGRSDEAISSYLKALDIHPEFPKAYSHLVHQLQHLCAWQELEAFSTKLDKLTAQALDAGKKPDEMPFLNLTRHADPSLNYKVAKAWSNEISCRVSGISQFYPTSKGTSGVKKLKESRIRVAYLSNNFKNHPTAHLIQGMFRHHNREKFEVHCYSYGEDDNSCYRAKIKTECDRFIDIRMLNHIDAARRIYDDGVDILVDLVGYMKANRLCIPALRPAPIQVRWLGLAGTTGADFFDYLIADALVVPEGQAPFYSEKLVHMPHCYQINDNTQVIRGNDIKRADFGLSEGDFVFCSFCSRYKLDPVIFESWMKILKQVPGSVLWLLGGSDTAEKNLMQAAESRGINCNRLVFAKKIPREDHLVRLQLADLALDTRIVNGAITTSDALWSGVPVITLQGSHFASRMSSSILSAAGLPEMVTHSLDGYETLGVRLAGETDELNAIRHRLVRNRLSVPLFDTALFVRNLEIAFEKMWDVYQCGDTPRPIRAGEILGQAT
jgi:protein O-GlcNAc transferase